MVAVGPKNIPSGFFSALDAASTPMLSRPTVSADVDVSEAVAQEGYVAELDIDELEVMEVNGTSEIQIHSPDEAAMVDREVPQNSRSSRLKGVPDAVRVEFHTTLDLVLD